MPTHRRAVRLLVAALGAGCLAAGGAAVVPGGASPARGLDTGIATTSGDTTRRFGGGDSTGAAGVGDGYFPTYGNGGYRVRHYDVRVRFDPATERLTGDTVVHATARQRLTRFNLDLALRARSVAVNGQDASISRRGRLELVVRPAQALSDGDPMRVRVRYAGVPAERTVDAYNPWVTTRDGAVAVGEPEISSWWFPSNDHPSDRASFDISVTAPRGHQVLSNGRLVERAPVGREWVRWHWRTTAPMATYLAFMAVGRYDIETGQAGGLPFTYAVSDLVTGRAADSAWRSLRRTGEITQWLEGRFGRYPFGSIGGVVPGGITSRNFGYALENQTRPLYDPVFFRAGATTSIVVHEMAHQWFGDEVAVARWRHIWLNEGFATYAEWMWEEHRGGESTQRHFRDSYHTLDAENPFWDLRIGDPGPGHLFDGRVYDRGAMTVHALRNRIGDRDFFTVARRWVHDNRDGLGTTGELRGLAQRVSGEPLGGLFRAWLFRGEKPAATAANGVQPFARG